MTPGNFEEVDLTGFVAQMGEQLTFGLCGLSLGRQEAGLGGMVLYRYRAGLGDTASCHLTLTPPAPSIP